MRGLSAIAALSLALALSAGRADAAVRGARPSPSEIREAAERVLARDGYFISERRERRINFAALIDQILEPIRSFLSALQVASPAVFWMVVSGLLLILAALIAHIAYTVRGALIRAPDAPIAHKTAAKLDPAQLTDEAERLAAGGNYTDAARALFRAAVTLLEEKRGGRVMPGLTYLEYVRTFKAPWVIENLQVFVQTINWKFYRGELLDAAEYARCRAAFDALELRLREAA